MIKLLRNMSCDLYALFVILFFIFVINVKSEKALIFNQNEGSLLEPKASDISALAFSVIACAARSPEELLVNIDLSINKKSLFVQNVHDDLVNVEEIAQESCYNSYEPSMIFEKTLRKFETGYEVYYVKEKFTELLETVEYDDFATVLDGVSRIKALLAEKPFPEVENETKLVLGEGKLLGFLWVNVLSIEFDVILKSPKKVEYKKDIGDKKITGDCQNYDLGKELYDGIDVDSLYLEEIQIEVLKRIQMPSQIVSKNKNPDPDPLKCGQQFGCFIKTPLIPYYYLNTYPALLASCTNAATVPVWNDIADESLKKVDQYLFVISEFWKPNISIYSGTLDILNLPSSGILGLPSDIYLDHKNSKVPIPRIIYKHVILKIEYEEDHVEYFHAVVVIHNDPISRSIIRLCPQKEELSGWEAIRTMKRKSGPTYVCPMSKNIYFKLISDLADYLEQPFLELDNFPYYNSKKKMFMGENMLEKINNKWEELFGEKSKAPQD